MVLSQSKYLSTTVKLFLWVCNTYQYSVVQFLWSLELVSWDSAGNGVKLSVRTPPKNINMWVESWVLCEKNPRRQELCHLCFLKTTELFLECAFMPRLAVAEAREFTSDFSSQLFIVICLCVSIENMFLSCAACPCDCTFHSRASSEPSEYKLIVWCSEESWLLHENLVGLIFKLHSPRFVPPAFEVNSEDAVVH